MSLLVAMPTFNTKELIPGEAISIYAPGRNFLNTHVLITQVTPIRLDVVFLRTDYNSDEDYGTTFFTNQQVASGEVKIRLLKEVED